MFTLHFAIQDELKAAQIAAESNASDGGSNDGDSGSASSEFGLDTRMKESVAAAKSTARKTETPETKDLKGKDLKNEKEKDKDLKEEGGGLKDHQGKIQLWTQPGKLSNNLSRSAQMHCGRAFSKMQTSPPQQSAKLLSGSRCEGADFSCGRC